MISGEDAVYKRVEFYCYLLVLGLVSTSAIFHCFSIKNSLSDLLITTVKIYEEIGNENTTDYRPLNFHDYYYNRTYVEALDFNINLIDLPEKDDIVTILVCKPMNSSWHGFLSFPIPFLRVCAIL